MSDFCDESFTLHRHELRKARKEHECDGCERTIGKGARYAHVFTLFDGRCETFKRCGACELTWQHLKKLCDERNAQGRNYSWEPGYYPREDLSCGLSYAGEWEDEPPPEISRLPFLSDAEVGNLLARRPA